MKRFLAFVGLGLLVLTGAGCDPRSEVNSNTAVRTETVSMQSWRDRVTDILSAYDSNADAVVARDALLALRVPGQAQEVHLALVLSLSSIVEGDSSARARFENARANFNAAP